MEAVRLQLLNEGHRGIPKSIVRLFEVLREHELLIPNQHGESVWTAEVNDFAKNWQQKLTFLRFKNEIIWPTSNPDTFDGEVSPVDKDGNLITEKKSIDDQNVICDDNTLNDQNISSNVRSMDESKICQNYVMGQGEKLVQKSCNSFDNIVPAASHSSNDYIIKKQITDSNVSSNSTKQSNKELDKKEGVKNGITSSDAKKFWKHSRKPQESHLVENDFIAWLLRGISRRVIRVNEAKAPVHILDRHVALVTPAIFNLYLDKNSLKKRLYEKRAENKKIYTLLQKELEKLDIHQRGLNGQNIVKMSVEGQRSQAELRVYLLNRDCFPSLANFSSNKVMMIQL